jgi:EmrB/QacA subfamily drug resistance transporter
MNEAPAARRRWVLALTAIASFMVALDALVVTTALTTMRLDLDASVEALEWTVNAYGLSFAALLLTGAALGDRFGRRRMFMGGLALFVAASAACALAGSAAALIAARTVQDVGAALVMPLAMALLGAAFPREQRAKALGIFGSVTGLALIAGPVAGGAIAAGLAWQWIFWINLPIGIVALVLIRRYIAESFGADTALDMTGLMLITGAALALVFALMRVNLTGWASLQVAAPLAIGVLLMAVFIIHERRAGAPMVPMRLFGSRRFAAGNAVGFLLYASMYGVVFFLPQFLQTAQTRDPLGVGLRLLPWTATLFIFAPIGGALVNRLGERPLVVGGLLLQSLGFAWIAWHASPDLPYGALVAPLIVAGAGVSMAMPAAQNAVLSAVGPAEIGKASGIFNTLRYFGGVLGVAVLVTAFAANGGFASGPEFTAGFVPALALAAALSLLGALAGFALPGRQWALAQVTAVTLALGLLLVGASAVFGQAGLPAVPQGAHFEITKSYPPLSEYLMPQDAETALARSAGPQHVAARATVKVLTPAGFRVAVAGDNGFVCMTMRGWAAPTYNPVQFRDFVYVGDLRAPICFDPISARTVMPYYELRHKLGLEGKSSDEIARGVEAAYAIGDLPKVEPSMAYMLSADMYLGPHLGHGFVYPHIMLFLPYYTNVMLGGNERRSGLPFLSDDAGTPFAVTVIPLDKARAVKAKVN